MSTATPAGDAKPRRLSPLPRAERGRACALPHPLLPLIGREDEVAGLTALLRRDGVRLVTLTGPGGVGKTRLALEVARALADSFADGVAFVPLAPVRDPTLVAATLVQALAIRDAGDRSPSELLSGYLRDRELLLVLDNFEHVSATAPLVTELLSGCPCLTVLVTSRARLMISGARDVAVPPLALPDRATAGQPLQQEKPLDDYPATRLFLERARAVNAEIALTEANTAAVVEICLRLDGLPLAIELAAARTTVLPPPALLARLATRLPMLTGGPRDAPPRLQTMRNAIAWSYDLLTADQQALFRRLAVFVGGFSLDAAEAVSRAVEQSSSRVGRRAPLDSSTARLLDLVTALVDQSLVRPVAAGGEDVTNPRFGMLETIREFGLERLAASGEEERARRVHASFVLALAEAAEDGLRGPTQRQWLDRLGAEHDNARAALTWAIEQQEADIAPRLAAALWLFWHIRGHLAEGCRWLERALAISAEAVIDVRATALNNLANLMAELGDVARAQTLYEQSLALCRELGDERAIADALNNLGLMAGMHGDYARARELLKESLTLRQEVNDLFGLPAGMLNLGDVAYAEGDHAQARHWHEAALVAARKVGNSRRVAQASNGLGLVALTSGDQVTARRWFDEALRLFREVADNNGVAAVFHNLGRLACRHDTTAQTARHYADALALHREIGDRRGVAQCLEGLAVAAIAAGEARSGTRLLGAAAAVREPLAMPFVGIERADHETGVAEARRRLGLSAFTAAWDAGTALAREDAIAEALSIAAVLSAFRLPSLFPIPRSLGTASSSAPSRGLTPREVDVLRLLADGASDREIAEALGIGVRTVETHVTNLLNKLGVNTRTAAAIAAMRQGLV